MSDRKEFALYLNEDMKETLNELQKRPTQAIATALIFAMSGLLHQKTKEEDLPDTLVELILEASKEALQLTDEVYFAQPASDTEIIH